MSSINQLFSEIKENKLAPIYFLMGEETYYIDLISQSAFDQIARYNLTLKASYLMVTNGLNHYFCTIDHNLGIYNFLKELPSYVKKKI